LTKNINTNTTFLKLKVQHSSPTKDRGPNQQDQQKPQKITNDFWTNKNNLVVEDAPLPGADVREKCKALFTYGV